MVALRVASFLGPVARDRVGAYFSGFWAERVVFYVGESSASAKPMFYAYLSPFSYGLHLHSRIHQDLWKWLDKSPMSTLGGGYDFKRCIKLTVKMDRKDRQQDPPHLALCSSSSKASEHKREHTSHGMMLAYKLFQAIPAPVNFDVSTM